MIEVTKKAKIAESGPYESAFMSLCALSGDYRERVQCDWRIDNLNL